MKIRDARNGDYLRGHNRFLKMDQYGYACNEMGIRIGGIDYDGDYELFNPPSIAEHSSYTAKVLGDSPSGSCMFMYLVLSEHGGEFHGFRHRYPVANYSVQIPIVFKSTDDRVGWAWQFWYVCSGQFFIYVKAHPNGVWEFTTGKPPTVRIDNGTSWIIVPSQK